MVRELQYLVPEEGDQREIKRIIRGTMGVSHRQFSHLKANGGIFLDGRPARANERARAGQRISLRLCDDDVTQRETEYLPVRVVYEDDDLIILDKDAPLPCQNSPRQGGSTLEKRLAARYGSQFVFRPINRLDKGTSGLMAAARNPHAQMLCARQLHTERFVREYLAVVEGCPHPASGWIDAPIAKAAGATIRREVRADGKPARTQYRVLQAGVRSLLRLRLETGRTHQIRVHTAYLGCPVAGDFLYGHELDALPGRFALHSARLEIDHPLTGERLRFESPLPESLRALL